MIFYILAAVVWLTLCVWKSLHSITRLHLPHYVFALPLIFLATLRGEVGTDTATYRDNVRLIFWWGDKGSSNEPGYDMMLRALHLVTGDPRVVVALLSLLAAVLFFAMLHHWEEGESALSLLLVPVCYFDFTMNGLRMGIAFPLAALAVLHLEKKRLLLFYALAIAAVSVQMTAAFLLLLLLLARFGLRLSWRGVGIGMLVAVSVLAPGYYFLGDRIALKFLSYAAMPAPSSLSGTGPLLLSLGACALALAISPRTRSVALHFVLIQLACFRLSSYTYAGLRFQEMALFAQILALSYGAARPLPRRQLAALVLLSLLAWGWTSRNFLQSAGEPSAFVPYRFVWEE